MTPRIECVVPPHFLVAAHHDVRPPPGTASWVATRCFVHRRDTTLAASNVHDLVDIVTVVLECERLGRKRRHVGVVVAEVTEIKGGRELSHRDA
jgi:hypothetical protein